MIDNMKKLDLLSYICYGLTGIIYLFIVFNTLTNPQNPDLVIKAGTILPLMAVTAVTVLAGTYIIYHFKYRKIFPVLFTVILVFLQAVAIRYLSVKYHVETWDMGVVYNAAEYYVTNGAFDMGKYDYFLWFPNNSPLYNIFVLLFKLFAALGITNTQLALNVFNAGLLVVSAWFVEKTVQVFAGSDFTGAGLMFCVALCPFSLYAVLAYTDTFSMVFLSAALYFYISAIKNKGNRYVNLVLFSLLCGFGASLKVSVLILAIAAVIDIVLKNEDLKTTAISLVLVLVIAFGGFAGFKYAHEHSAFLPEYDYNYTIPYTHWVMMGLNGLGGYNDDDYQLITLQYPDKQSRQQANIEEIIRRVEEKGGDGMIQHLKNKLSFIYSEGTFGACYKLDRAVVRPNTLHEYIIYLGTKFEYLGNFSLALFMMMLSFLSAGVIMGIKNRDSSAAMPAMSLIGVTIFLLIWEARARYILNFLPLFILMAVFGIKQLFYHNKNQ